MKLRKLAQKDAQYMLEWMHDDSVVHNLNRNFAAMTMKDCDEFIQNSQACEQNLHLAITDDNDEYQGTVSLKNIVNNTAEFGITIRKCAMGTGISHKAMEEIFRIGKVDYNISKVYWCVSPENVRAVRFYDKNGYQRIQVSEINAKLDYTPEQCDNFIWYCVCL